MGYFSLPLIIEKCRWRLLSFIENEALLPSSFNEFILFKIFDLSRVPQNLVKIFFVEQTKVHTIIFCHAATIFHFSKINVLPKRIKENYCRIGTYCSHIIWSASWLNEKNFRYRLSEVVVDLLGVHFLPMGKSKIQPF